MKDLITYIGHSYHSKTKSTVFLVELLKQKYEVKEILDESWKGHNNFDIDTINEQSSAVIFFQLIPNPLIVNRLKCKNIIFFPMYDYEISRKLKYIYWKLYNKIRVINFSKTLHEEFKKIGLESYYFQYFPKPLKFEIGDNKKIYFWNRINSINLELISSLIDKKSEYQLHIHNAPDPGHNAYKKVNSNTLGFKSVRETTWTRSKTNTLREISSCGIYIAPRVYEGIGISFLEAMSMGKAVVACDNPTMNEYIINNRTGYLYQPMCPSYIDFSNIKTIQSDCYTYINDGYEIWQTRKNDILEVISI